MLGLNFIRFAIVCQAELLLAALKYLPAVTDLYSLRTTVAALTLAGVEPQIAGCVFSGEDVLVTVLAPVG
ncbi:hypothetical protein [Nitrosomonas communis]|uniref:hypothetical protein n=1 Tax=Nitrosomonas communis TaxID=44574 RepID=UPI0026F0C824|nr:hypothetical protein [Nitrosomonas communis]